MYKKCINETLLEVVVDVMARSRSPDRKKAFKIWVDSGREKKPKEIAMELGVNASMIRKWKSLDNWDEQPDPKPGAPKGNKNATGNKGGAGGPYGNDKAVKHGLFRKFLPDDPEYHEIFEATEEMSMLDMLWMQIRTAWTNILWAQRPMHVKNKEEMIKELKKRKYQVENVGTKESPSFEQFLTEEEFEFQFAWDRQATALNSQSAAMTALTRMIKQYEDMLRSIPPKDIREEQRLRINLLKAEVKEISDPDGSSGVTIVDDIPAGEES
jgi:uncharacterized protein YjcR